VVGAVYTTLVEDVLERDPLPESANLTGRSAVIVKLLPAVTTGLAGERPIWAIATVGIQSKMLENHAGHFLFAHDKNLKFVRDTARIRRGHRHLPANSLNQSFPTPKPWC
jgi:hypothetical protein